MNPIRCSTPSRRFIQSALQDALPVMQAFRSSRPLAYQSQQQQPSQCRHYVKRPASRASSPSLMAKKPIPRQRMPQGLLFSMQNLSRLEFWEQRVAEQGPRDLTAEMCLNATIQYCSVATRDDSSWKGKLSQEHGLNNYILHYTAILQLFGSPDQKVLGFHMLQTASDLGYGPSTMVLYRMLLQAEDLNKGVQANLFRQIEPRFTSLLLAPGGKRDPNLLTLQGLMLQRRGDDDAALQFFDQAIEAAAGSKSSTNAAGAVIRKPRWELEATCYLGRGRILQKHDVPDVAEQSYRVAAFELDVADGYMELAQMLPESSSEREECLLKVAQSGHDKACLLLAQSEAAQAAAKASSSSFPSFPSSSSSSSSSSPEEKMQEQNHLKRAAEWFHLGGEVEVANQIRASV
ncbi:hypothetical protein B0H63DRAFT_513109 [Podospora didyma]|uniref:Uncharacterized protein n=1 Tax=Podospora didyma TaxID=330526 RepID=A0AAE0N8V7_9PEZI|nr:hypothetical protein B0H63DRAFT_513109 [Podospora didyma]